MDKIEYYEFRRDLYFFDLVSCFSVSLCGCPIIFDARIPLFLEPNQSISFPGKFTSPKHMSPHRLRAVAESNATSKSSHIASCCIMLANTAYESVKDYNDGSELFEFFRHIRNASSHLNTFQFNQREPAHPAKWRGATIDHRQKGQHNPLFGQQCFGHFMGVADLLDLLMDIEKKIIELQEKS
ncbi:hypothetical protein [Echinimonas agarilytica]|uniref:Uncharacterized protein n=1 Tax=Echinimonas agarilytica TaxID=1215918 RepID=A0AA41WAZ1_9GAMM|nr:hypothetical protein [Echinimonas agarilytica]MCM2681089.1 hypothetical protein [Echinimonas agarilytica]